MAAGEYIGSKSQREIFDAQVIEERDEIVERPGEAEAEVAYMLAEEGLGDDDAARVAAIMARHPEVLLRTMVTRELGIQVDEAQGGVLRGALFMGAAFGLGAAVPGPAVHGPADRGGPADGGRPDRRGPVRHRGHQDPLDEAIAARLRP